MAAPSNHLTSILLILIAAIGITGMYLSSEHGESTLSGLSSGGISGAATLSPTQTFKNPTIPSKGASAHIAVTGINRNSAGIFSNPQWSAEKFCKEKSFPSAHTWKGGLPCASNKFYNFKQGRDDFWTNAGETNCMSEITCGPINTFTNPTITNSGRTGPIAVTGINRNSAGTFSNPQWSADKYCREKGFPAAASFKGGYTCSGIRFYNFKQGRDDFWTDAGETNCMSEIVCGSAVTPTEVPPSILSWGEDSFHESKLITNDPISFAVDIKGNAGAPTFDMGDGIPQAPGAGSSYTPSTNTYRRISPKKLYTTPGSYTLKASLAGQTITRTITIKAAPGGGTPDLYFAARQSGQYPRPTISGGNAVVTTNMYNFGTAPASNFQLRARLRKIIRTGARLYTFGDFVPSAETTVTIPGPIGPAQSGPMNVSLPLTGVPAGEYAVDLTLDPNNLIKELREDDGNTLSSLDFVVGTLPVNPTVKLVLPLTQAARPVGTQIPMTVRVENSGDCVPMISWGFPAQFVLTGAKVACSAPGGDCYPSRYVYSTPGTYQVRGKCGQALSEIATLTIQAAPSGSNQPVLVTLEPSVITKGQSTTLRWQDPRGSVTSCNFIGPGIPGGLTSTLARGSMPVTPTDTSAYVVSCTGAGTPSVVSGSGIVTVNPATAPQPTLTITSAPLVAPNSQATITFTPMSAAYAIRFSWNNGAPTSPVSAVEGKATIPTPSAGTHTLRAELLDPSSRPLSPPVIAEQVVTVGTPSCTDADFSCPDYFICGPNNRETRTCTKSSRSCIDNPSVVKPNLNRQTMIETQGCLHAACPAGKRCFEVGLTSWGESGAHAYQRDQACALRGVVGPGTQLGGGPGSYELFGRCHGITRIYAPATADSITLDWKHHRYLGPGTYNGQGGSGAYTEGRPSGLLIFNEGADPTMIRKPYMKWYSGGVPKGAGETTCPPPRLVGQARYSGYIIDGGGVCLQSASGAHAAFFGIPYQGTPPKVTACPQTQADLNKVAAREGAIWATRDIPTVEEGRTGFTDGTVCVTPMPPGPPFIPCAQDATWSTGAWSGCNNGVQRRTVTPLFNSNSPPCSNPYDVKPAEEANCGVRVTINSPSSTVGITGTTSFSATVTGTTNNAVTWRASAGIISPAGVFTPSGAGTVTIIATSAADPTRTATATITVVNPSIRLEGPSSAALGSDTHIKLTVSNAPRDYTIRISVDGTIKQDAVLSIDPANPAVFYYSTRTLTAGSHTITFQVMTFGGTPLGQPASHVILIQGLPSVSATNLALNKVPTGGPCSGEQAPTITDGTFKGEGTIWNQACVIGGGSTLTINLQAAASITRLVVQADNNDVYKMEFSADGTTYSNPVQINEASGSGLRKREINLPAPVNARYLRLSVVRGDNSYSVSEIQAFGTATTVNPTDSGATTATNGQIYNSYTSLTGNAPRGATALPVDSVTGFAANDEVLILQMQHSTAAGTYETATIASVAGTTINLKSGLQNAYESGTFNSNPAKSAQVVKVPRFSTINVPTGITVTATPWDGRKGGVIALKASSSITLNGVIDASGKGFRGGTDQNPSPCAEQQGESTAGIGKREAGANAGGGGAGWQENCQSGDYWASGGGGASHRTAGTPSSGHAGPAPISAAGTIYGSTTRLTLGSGGGAGGSWSGLSQGGNGGGIILLVTPSLTGTGTITSNGAGGFEARTGGSAGGGGGAGGTITIQSPTKNIPVSNIQAAGGPGNAGTPHSEKGEGGNGGTGWIN